MGLVVRTHKTTRLRGSLGEEENSALSIYRYWGVVSLICYDKKKNKLKEKNELNCSAYAVA